ncbi:hypothetical protein K493DRAFT_406620 [Basidiobolus meristosporus CBS 931.73]|uniref:Uncharacterized protein n=1 Tax=Basidiobolus meristosporus CBS 931.73 TaxID=1314790 RepID=A0A1Y1YJY5_9FUNG|nr:hypothetical protein K493DRAFT_406620 [Basidiobolus meristosporus CBS 931.73]|eukprot:ORX98337.1 hypothetical protein K493DRAFT_406620 [Basidiobolus meristosporus CBS 931.73]
MFNVMFKIVELDTKAKELKPSECTRGIIFACVSQFNIDSENPSHTITMAECKSCATKFHYLVGEGCPTCGNSPDRYFYNLTHQLSFIDDTAELHTPVMDDYAMIKLIGYRPEEFATLNSHEKTVLKYSVLFERFKLFFMMYKNEMKQSTEIRLVDCERANLEEMLNLTYLVSEMDT